MGERDSYISLMCQLGDTAISSLFIDTVNNTFKVGPLSSSHLE